MLLFAAAAVSLIAATRLSFANVRRARQPRQAARGTAAVDNIRGAQEIPVRRLRPTVSVVIPALNEERSIDWVLANIPPSVSEVVLVDGLSTDLTEAVARRVRPDIVVVHQPQRGKGAALRAGFAAARGDIIAMLDADGSTDPRELDSFLTALEEGADFVKGSRSLSGGGSVDLTLLRRAGNLGFVLLVNLLYRARFTDLCYGYCAFWRRHLDVLALTAHGFEIETQLVLNALNAGLRIREVPSRELARRAGRSNLRAFRDGRSVLITILRDRAASPPRPAPTNGRIELRRLEKPSLESGAWLPAGYDRRRGERRTRDRLASGYTGPERRRGERRQASRSTNVVYMAHSHNSQDSAKAAAAG
jgi:glycosyl transferase family 2